MHAVYQRFCLLVCISSSVLIPRTMLAQEAKRRALAEGLIRVAEEIMEKERAILDLSQLAVADSSDHIARLEWETDIMINLHKDAIYLLNVALQYDSTDVRVLVRLGDAHYRFGAGPDATFDADEFGRARQYYEAAKERIVVKNKMTDVDLEWLHHITRRLSDIEQYLRLLR